MKRPASLPLIAVYLLASFAGLIVVIGIILASWYSASRLYLPKNGACLRLRWYVAARTEIPRGTKITETNLISHFGRIPEGDRFISSNKMAVGKYALEDFKKNVPLCPELLSDRAPVSPPAKGAALPIEVKTELTEGLRPGMRLAFVQNKNMLPKATSQHQGFLLLTMALSTSDAKKTILTVAVPQQESAVLPILATGEWHPVYFAPK